jgi:hypothetical protein
MQDAVIAMAIIVVVLALWRLQARQTQLASFILGHATTNLVFGSRPAGDGSGPHDGQGGGQVMDTNQPSSTTTNPIASGSNPPPAPSVPPNPDQVLLPDVSETNSTNVLVFSDPSFNAEDMQQRLDLAGAKGGDIQISLFWKNVNDLDLHCIDPQGEEIYYRNKKSSRTGGELDVDRNASPPYTTSPVENIYWPAGGAPPGLYRVSVVHYANHGGTDPTAFTVRIVIQGQTNFFSSTITYASRNDAKPVRAFQYDPANADPSRCFQFVP